MYVKSLPELFVKLSPIKKKTNDNSYIYDIIMIFIVTLFLIFIAIIVYHNLKDNREEKYNNIILKNLPRDLKPIDNCSYTKNYRLIDYYIASSYNTASLGGNHYDYVSLNAIKNTLLQGARYIQLNIFSTDVDINNKNDEPVVATNFEDNKYITSLNTILFKDVLEIINSYAFKVKDKKGFKKINYPLIIDIQVNTHNKHVLDKAAQYIKDIFNSNLLNNRKYLRFPIQYEYLCNMLNKIIIWTNPNSLINNSDLKDVVINKNSLIKKFNINQIQFSTLSEYELEQYLLGLSKLNINTIYNNNEELQKYVNQLLDINSKDSILRNSINYNNSIDVENIINIKVNDENKINRLHLDNKMVFFNSIGMSIIEPENSGLMPEAYDFRLPISIGCQCICMPYHDINNIHFKYYRDFFKDSSFILKPSNIRLPDEISTDEIDLLEKYQLVKDNEYPFNYNVKYNNFNYLLIYLQEISSTDRKFVNIKANNLLLRPNKFWLLLKKQKINNSYTEIDAFYIINPFNINLCLTVKNNFDSINDNLEFRPINRKINYNQLFIIENGLETDNLYSLDEEIYISIRSLVKFTTEKPFYLSLFRNKIIVKERDTVSTLLMTFNTGNKPAIFKSIIMSLLYGNIHIYQNGFAAINNKKQNRTPVLINYKNQISNKEIMVSIKYNNKFLCNIEDKLATSDSECTLNLININKNIYFIKSNNKYLSVNNDDGLLEFKASNNLDNVDSIEDVDNRLLVDKFFIIQNINVNS